MSQFGTELRRRREAAGLSLTQFARRTNFSKGYLSKIETGRSPASRYIAEVCDQALEAAGDLLALIPDEAGEQPIIALPDPGTLFVGRAAELKWLTERLHDPEGPAILVIAGLGGIGKTALAVAAARRTAESFPGGQFLVDLGPADPRAPAESDCLERALRAMGVPGREIPEDPAGRRTLLTSRTGGRPTLVLVDDAVSAEQLRAMPVAGGSCRLLVTSRRRLAALDEAEHLALGPLPADEAEPLFRSIAGSVDADGDEVVSELVARCAYVPLAVRITAVRLRHGGWTAAEMLDRLTDEASRVASMDDGERSMAAILGASIESLADPERLLLALLGIHPGPAADLPATAALAGLPPTRTEVLLTRLHESGLVTRRPGGLIVLHELVRSHVVAVEVPRLPPAARDTALELLTDHLVRRVAAADAVIEPDRFRPPMEPRPTETFVDATAGARWLHSQWPVAVEVMARARDAGLLEPCWQLAFLLRAFFFREKLIDPWLRSTQLALSAAEEAGASRWAGMLRNGLGMAHLERGDFAAAAACHLQAEEVSSVAGDRFGATDARASLAWVRLHQGAYEQALLEFDAALGAYREQERPRSECITLRGMALAAAWLGRDGDATSYANLAVPLARTTLDRAMTSNCAAWVAYRAGRLAVAAQHYGAAAELSRGESDYELARALTGLGNAAAAAGDRHRAVGFWAEADQVRVWLDVRSVGEAAARQLLAVPTEPDQPA